LPDLDHPSQQGIKAHGFAFEAEFAVLQARHVQQVVDQPHQPSGLGAGAGDVVAGALIAGRFGELLTEELEIAVEGSQRGA
jgi:hypothetical protein